MDFSPDSNILPGLVFGGQATHPSIPKLFSIDASLSCVSLVKEMTLYSHFLIVIPPVMAYDGVDAISAIVWLPSALQFPIVWLPSAEPL